MHLEDISVVPQGVFYIAALLKKYGYDDESIQILTDGIKAFPRDEQLNLCMAVSYMNMGDYQKALSYLSELRHLKEGIYLTAKCYQALDDLQKAGRYPQKDKSMNKTI
ncbi:MAG: hypothetical protein PVH43_15480 [Desulfobacterales bacterium]